MVSSAVIARGLLRKRSIGGWRAPSVRICQGCQSKWTVSLPLVGARAAARPCGRESPLRRVNRPKRTDGFRFSYARGHPKTFTEPVIERTRAAPAERTSAVFVEASARCDCETTWTSSRTWQAPPSDAWTCLSIDVTAISDQQGCSLGICRSILSSGDKIWESPGP